MSVNGRKFYPVLSPGILVCKIQDVRKMVAGLIPNLANFSIRIDDSHCNRIHTSLTANHFFSHDGVGKQPLAFIEYCAVY